MHRQNKVQQHIQKMQGWRNAFQQKRGEVQSILKNVPHHGWVMKKTLKSTSCKTALEGNLNGSK